MSEDRRLRHGNFNEDLRWDDDPAMDKYRNPHYYDLVQPDTESSGMGCALTGLIPPDTSGVSASVKHSRYRRGRWGTRDAQA